VSDPMSPHIVGSVDTYYARGVYVAGDYAYVADSSVGLKVIDVRPEAAAPTHYGLTVVVEPEGSGTVEAEGIECPEDCSEEYEEGTEVVLTATAAEGYEFVGWGGDCAGCEGPTCTVVMDGNKTCVAQFEEWWSRRRIWW